MSESVEEDGGEIDYLPGDLVEGRYAMRATAVAEQVGIVVRDPGAVEATASEPDPAAAGAIGLRTRNVAADFEYIVVFARD